MKQIKYEQCGIGSVLLVALVLSYRRQLLSSYYQNRVFLGVTDFFLGSLFCLFVVFFSFTKNGLTSCQVKLKRQANESRTRITPCSFKIADRIIFAPPDLKEKKKKKLSHSKILRSYSIVHVAMETTKTSNFIGQSKSFISIFLTCHVLAR